MVSVRPPNSISSCPQTKPLETVPSAPITISITVIFMFHSLVCSLVSFKYLSFFFFVFFVCLSVVRWQSLLFGRLFFLSLVLVFWSWPCDLFFRKTSSLCKYFYSSSQISLSCTFHCGWPFLPSQVYSYTHFTLVFAAFATWQDANASYLFLF